MSETPLDVSEPAQHSKRTDLHRKLDWSSLRADSLKPGGFGSRRVELWPQLLQISKSALLGGSKHQLSDSTTPHRDERQIKLDTERSFVLYPVVSPLEGKEELQTQLHELIVSIFRKRPTLSYFQGYHDIVTVLFLTLPPELQLVCAEKLSLQRVRDSMGSGLEPVLGLLRVMKHLLRLADPSLASVLEQISPLPYYALSNLLTLFSHDMPSLPLIQHVFDYLLCRPPIMVVYLATAIILSRKAEIERLVEEGEEGMVHSLLSGLPDIHDEIEAGIQDSADDTSDTGANPILQLEASEETQDVYIPLDEGTDTATPETITTSSLDTVSPTPSDSTLPVDTSNEDDSQEGAENTHVESTFVEEVREPGDEGSSNLPDKQPAAHDIVISDQGGVSDQEGLHDEESLNQHQGSPLNTPLRPQRPKISLSTLLITADELYDRYPPNHADISLTSIMGPQSVVFTWSESKSEMPSDNEAERMVEKPELIVRPYIDPDEAKQEDYDHKNEYPDNDSKHKRHRRRLRKKLRFGHVEKRTVVAGAVLAVGVAVAVYGMRTRSANGVSLGKDGLGQVKEWQKLGGWFGGALMSVGERIFHTKML